MDTKLTTQESVTPQRRIGPRGTAARLLVGIAMLAAAAIMDQTTALHWVLGIVVLPLGTVFFTTVILRGRADARWIGPIGHVANIAIVATLMSIAMPLAFTFYGTALLLASWRGDAGCEVFSFSNALLHRQDELGCPVFSPIDHIEDLVTTGEHRRRH